jgi:hypothetical protein
MVAVRQPIQVQLQHGWKLTNGRETFGGGSVDDRLPVVDHGTEALGPGDNGGVWSRVEIGVLQVSE